MTRHDRIRSYWLTAQAAVGAIHRTADAMVVICDIRRWNEHDGAKFGEEIFALSRLKGVLGAPKTLRKPHFREDISLASAGMAPSQQIPIIRFPAWLHCPNPDCGHLAHLPWRGGPTLSRVRCRQCAQRPVMAPAPWVLAGNNGFLGDVEWHWLAHEKHARNACAERSRLFLKRDPKSNQDVLHCRACGAAASAHDLEYRNFAERFESGSRYIPFQPWDWTLTLADWLSQHNQKGGTSSGTEIRALRPHDSRLHLPVTRTAVDIPPESRKNPNDLRYRIPQHKDYERLRNIQRPKQLEEKLRQLANSLNAEVDEVKAAWDDLHSSPEPEEENPAPETQAELYADEYKAFCTDWGRMKSWERFLVKDMTEQWRNLECGAPSTIVPKIQRLVSVERLREVQVLLGFRRLTHESPLVPPDLKGQAGWLPANELHGEGIFFTLNPQALSEWERHPAVARRACEIRKRFERKPLPVLAMALAGEEAAASAEMITPRFLLLHTLAHLLIRQLEFVAGVPAASIRERIYCSSDDKTGRMAGALLYTTSQDRVGSLAGLSVIARPANFHELLVSAIRRGAWCSFDPVCSEHEGSGPSLLNRAACHGCALLPEPSCCYSNLLLDRQFVIGNGTSESPLPGYFCLEGT